MRRIKDMLGKARGAFPLTWAGTLALTVAFVATWWVGVGTSDLVLTIGGACVIALILAFLAAVMIGSAVMGRQVHRLGSQSTANLLLECGRSQRTALHLTWPGWLPFLHFELSWVGHEKDIDAQLLGSGRHIVEVVTPSRRGSFDNVERKLTVRDGLRLASVSFRFGRAQSVQVLPAAGQGRERMVLHNLVQGEDLSSPLGDPMGDRVDMRQYAKGDSPKTILWKVFARTRKLMVKVPEHAVAARPRNCAYLVSMPDDEPAASLARDIVEGDLLGDGWRFGADGTPGFTTVKSEALSVAARSGNEEARHSPCGLARFLHEASQAGYRSCFVLLGSDPTARREEVHQALSQSGVRVILCVTAQRLGWFTDSRWQRWLLSGSNSSPGSVSLEQLDALWSAWGGSAGREVRFADRSTGEIYRDVPGLTRALRARQK